MYRTTILASMALMASTALAGSPGQAIVVNQCSYPVYVHNTPSADGVHEVDSKTLQTGDTYSQTWTQLANKNGWSIKLSKTDSIVNGAVLQYEYTWNNDGTIWYDLSAVNGNPWAGDWQVSSASAGCNPRQTWYRFDTDDAFGMQDCTDNSSITVTLCPGSSVQAAVSSAVAAVTSAWVAPTVAATTPQAPATTVPATTAPTTTAPTTTVHTEPAHTEPAHTESAHTESAHTETNAAPLATGHPLGWENNHFVNAAVVEPTKTAAPTTLITTAATPVVEEDSNVVTEIVTVVETAIAYETYVPGKRHVHHPNHPHFR